MLESCDNRGGSEKSHEHMFHRHAEWPAVADAVIEAPLCSFPTQARYAGDGDVNSAANWSCTANQDLLQVGPNGTRAGLEDPTR
jgi:hypothetical protein